METCIPIKDIRGGMKNINVVFIILEAQSSTRTKEGRDVFSFKVGDPTACINCSIWDEPGKILVPGDIVKITKGYAAIWRQTLTLYSGKSGEVFRMGDFCMVFNEQVNMSEPIPPAQQNQVQGNHINANNGTNGGNGNGRNANQIGQNSNASLPPSATQNATKSSKSPANAPTKNYVRKPINKK